MTSRYHHGDLRAALLDHGERLLAGGAAGLSLRAVARAAGVSHTAPYRHFADKDALLRAIAAAGFDALGTAVRGAAAKHPGDPRAQLIAAGVAYVRLARRHPERLNLMFGGHLESDAFAADADLATAGRTAFDEVIAIVRGGVDVGVLRADNPVELALAAWATVHGFAQLAISGALGVGGPLPQSDAAWDRRAARICERLIEGLRPATPAARARDR